jgi:hypothetical protein
VRARVSTHDPARKKIPEMGPMRAIACHFVLKLLSTQRHAMARMGPIFFGIFFLAGSCVLVRARTALFFWDFFSCGLVRPRAC